MKLLNHKGMTLVETLASVVILSFVFTVVITIIVNIRVQTIRTEERVVAIEVAKTIRDQIEADVDYIDLIAQIENNNLSITIDNCELITGCSWFAYEVGDDVFDEEVSIVFLQSTTDSLFYNLIHFEVRIHYFKDEFLTVEGLIYE